MIGALHILDWLVLVLYIVAIIFVGFFRTRHTGKSQEEFILAGRRLSLPGFVASLVATWYGGILGVGENTFLYGIQTWVIFGLPYYIFALMFALWLAPKIRNKHLMSIPDHFHHTYGKIPGVISGVYLLFLSSPAPYILSIGILLQYSFGIPFGWALIFATGVSLIYIWYGGFGAVVRTDILQFILMFTGFILLIGFAWTKTGSPFSLLSQLPESHLNPTGGHSIQYIMVWFFIALWTFVDPGFYQRCAAAKTPLTAKKGIIISIGFWFFFDLLTLTAGLYARVLIPNSVPLFSLPELGHTLLPPLFYGLFLVGILSTIMSTIDSLGLISAVTYGRDIIWRLRKSTWTHTRDLPTYLTRQGLIVMASISMILAFSLQSVVKLWYTIGSLVIPGLLLPFLLTFTKKTIRSSSAVVLLVLPVVISAGWFLARSFFTGYPFVLEPFYPGVITSILVFFAISKEQK